MGPKGIPLGTISFLEQGIPAPVCSLARNDTTVSLPHFLVLLLAEGLAVGALVSSGVGLVSTNQNPLQGAEIGILAVMGALLDSTLNALVCMAIHRLLPPFRRDGLRLPGRRENIHFVMR